MFDPTNFINNSPYLGIFVLLILGAIGLPFPEDTTVMPYGGERDIYQGRVVKDGEGGRSGDKKEDG
jgi:hypothetical protein